jgi:hypothetical protein
MKSIKKFGFVVVLAVSTILSSCSSSDGGGGGSVGVGTLKAKIGSANFSSITQATTAILANNGSYQNLSIGGATTTGKTLQIMILGENIGVGTYQISDSNDSATTFVYSEVNINNPTSGVKSWAAPYDGGGNSGSVVITSMTASNVQGTFSLTALDLTNGTGTTQVSNGAFNINLTSN